MYLWTLVLGCSLMVEASLWSLLKNFALHKGLLLELPLFSSPVRMVSSLCCTSYTGLVYIKTVVPGKVQKEIGTVPRWAGDPQADIKTSTTTTDPWVADYL